MLIIRVYSILDTTAVEVSCVHGSEPLASHLVYRATAARAEGPRADLEAAAEVLQQASWDDERGELQWTDDCGL